MHYIFFILMSYDSLCEEQTYILNVIADDEDKRFAIRRQLEIINQWNYSFNRPELQSFLSIMACYFHPLDMTIFVVFFLFPSNATAPHSLLRFVHG